MDRQLVMLSIIGNISFQQHSTGVQQDNC